MKGGRLGSKPRLKDGVIPTFVARGWKKTRTVPRVILPRPAPTPAADYFAELARQSRELSALEHESQATLGISDTVQAIRSQLHMRQKKRAADDGQLTTLQPNADLYLDLDVDSHILTGENLGLPEAVYGEGHGKRKSSVPVLTSRGITQQQQRAVAGSTAAAGDATWQTNLAEDASLRFQDVAQQQREVCARQLTLRRQVDEMCTLQARHEADCDEQGFDPLADAASLFPPVDLAEAWPEAAAAGGNMQLEPTTLSEARHELHRQRLELLKLRTQLLDMAAAANERALSFNRQTAAVLRVFTPRQLELLMLEQPALSGVGVVWDAESLRRAIQLRSWLNREQYELVRTALRLPLPPLRTSAAAAQDDPDTSRLYRVLLDACLPLPGDEAVTAPRERGSAAAGTNGRQALVMLRGWDRSSLNDAAPPASTASSGLATEPSSRQDQFALVKADNTQAVTNSKDASTYTFEVLDGDADTDDTDEYRSDGDIDVMAGGEDAIFFQAGDQDGGAMSHLPPVSLRAPLAQPNNVTGQLWSDFMY